MLTWFNLIVFPVYIHVAFFQIQNHTHVISVLVLFVTFLLSIYFYFHLNGDSLMRALILPIRPLGLFKCLIFFNWLYDRMAQIEVAARQLCHKATGVSSARVSYKMINVLFVRVSNYINELFIIKAHTGTVIDKDKSVCCQCCSVSEIWMSEANSTDRHSSALPSCLAWLCEVCVRGLH